MLQNKDTWPKYVLQAIADLKSDGKDGNPLRPTVGKNTAIATARFIRDGIFDDAGVSKGADGKWHVAQGDQAKPVDENKPLFSIKDIRESISELIGDLSKNGADAGFASNASAAAKAAGFKGSEETIVALVD